MNRAPMGILEPGKRREMQRKARQKKTTRTLDLLAATFRGVEKATGKNCAAETIQHVTTEAECREWIEICRAMFTIDGKLDKEGYCSALNTTRDNILFTARQLTLELNDARRSGNKKAAESYETIINIDQTNAGIIAEEIRQNGGKVNQEG